MRARRRHPIATARHARGLSRADLATCVHVAEMDVARWERGIQWPSVVEAVRVARHLQLSLAEVLIDVIEAQAALGAIPAQQARAG